MNNTIFRALAAVVLLIFLTPLIGTEIHSLSHIDDVHCTETGLHFHQEEHHCNLCDFLLPVGTSPNKFEKDFVNYPSFLTLIHFHNSGFEKSVSDIYFSLRAPPYFA
jgi:hypothetical protein